MSEEPQRRWNDVAAAVAVAVNQAMKPFQDTLRQLERDVMELRTTVYGNPNTRQLGLVELVRGIDGKLDELIEQRKQNTWLMRGVAAGLALNVAQMTGLLPALIRLLGGV